MQRLKIKTTQNVDIEYRTADIGSRILAALIDYIILLLYFIGMFILSIYVNEAGYTPDIFVYIIIYLPVFFYDLLCEIFLNGQSFGKMLRHIKVVKLDGSQPTIGSYLLRWVFRIIDVGFSSGSVAIFTILINGRGQRLGDIAAGTTVVSLKQDVTLKDTIYTPVLDNYNPVFPQAANLPDETISTIKEIINYAAVKKLESVREKLLVKTKENVEQALQIKTSIPPLRFLQTVLKDFNYINGKV